MPKTVGWSSADGGSSGSFHLERLPSWVVKGLIRRLFPPISAHASLNHVQPLLPHQRPAATIRDWFRVSRNLTGNLPPMPGIFPDFTALITRSEAH